ncbi:MAG: hypothetical protein IJS32_07560 [Kiritimatiellae bacterium]|nr:hypothetical protein [Kiritimatiellia bacterium]
MKRLLLLLLLLSLPAFADEFSGTKLSVDYGNVAFTEVLADIGSKITAMNPEEPFPFIVRLDRSAPNELPAITLRADGISLEELLSELDALTGLYHVENGYGYRFMPPPRNFAEAERCLNYRKNDELLFPYAIQTVADADGGTAWLFTCESIHGMIKNPFRDAESDEEEKEWTETVVFRVDSSGKVDELSREPSEKRPFPPLWPSFALNYCRAAGIDPDSLSNLAADAETNMVFVVGTNAPFRVSLWDLARAEKAYFFKTVSEADRIVVRDGGFDCCVPEEDIDRQRTLVVLTNAAEVATFTAMIQFEDSPSGGFSSACAAAIRASTGGRAVNGSPSRPCNMAKRSAGTPSPTTIPSPRNRPKPSPAGSKNAASP